MMFKWTFLLIAAQYLTLASAQGFSCEEGKGICVFDTDCSPNSPDKCELIAAIERKDNKTFTFHIAGNAVEGPKESYLAIGLSLDNKMGEDAVVACFHDGVHTFINPKKQNPSTKLDWGAGSLSKSVSAVTGDRLTCSFDLPSKIEAGPGISIDLNGGNKIFLMVAVGPTKDIDLDTHTDHYDREMLPSALTDKIEGSGSGSGTDNGNTKKSNASMTSNTGGFKPVDFAVYVYIGVAASIVRIL